MKKINIFSRKRFWAGILSAQFLLFFILAKFHSTLIVFERFFEIQKVFHQKIFAVFPFSVGDLLYILLAVLMIFYLLKIFKKKTRNHFVLKFLILLNLLYFLYQIFWGMLYFQTPLAEKLPNEEITLQDTKTLALKYLNLCKQTRNRVSEDRNGVFKLMNLKLTEQEILLQQSQLPSFISSKKPTGINSFKSSLWKAIMSSTGILGYYNPFTGEAQFNPELPSTYLPFTLAHESAHQLGFAREQEANFIGYLIGKDSKNAELKYSTQYFVLKSLLNDLVEKDPEFVRKIIRSYSSGMKRDRLAEKMFVKKNEGFLNDFFGFTNDLFLKSNRQDGSITYSYFTGLLIRYEKMNANK
ncbi:DUF3810 domain-containing protein [Chryseobacterium sp.]|nr:DUF3810 domain-containing protein [Chryseobacterium sp.]